MLTLPLAFGFMYKQEKHRYPMLLVENTGFEPVTASDFWSECSEPASLISLSIIFRLFQLLIFLSRCSASFLLLYFLMYLTVQSLAFFVNPLEFALCFFSLCWMLLVIPT